MASETIVQTQEPVKAPKPLRVMITAAATAAYYDLTDEALKKRLLDRLVTVCRHSLALLVFSRALLVA